MLELRCGPSSAGPLGHAVSEVNSPASLLGGQGRYCGFGLIIDSTLPLPGAEPLEAAGDPPHADLIIRAGSAQITRSGRRGPYSWAPGAMVFDMPAVARYLCHDHGRQLTVEPAPLASPDEVAAMLIATALPLALWMRGDLVLHTATVILPGRQHALALAGPSGIGKTTLLHALVEAGSSVLGDDTLCLRSLPGQTELEASGLPACLQLRPDHDSVPNGGPDPHAPRVAAPVPAAQQRRTGILRTMVVLEPARLGTGPALRRLRGAEALTALLRSRHRPRIPVLLGRQPELLATIARLAAETRIYSFQPGPGEHNYHDLLEQLDAAEPD